MTLTLRKRYSSRECPGEGLFAMRMILVVYLLNTSRWRNAQYFWTHSHSKREKIYMYIIMLSPKIVGWWKTWKCFRLFYREKGLTMFCIVVINGIVVIKKLDMRSTRVHNYNVQYSYSLSIRRGESGRRCSAESRASRHRHCSLHQPASQLVSFCLARAFFFGLSFPPTSAFTFTILTATL